MLFRVNRQASRLESAGNDWTPKELELERLLIEKSEDGAQVLNSTVFGEPLLILRNQLRTRAGKRADIFALDRLGNGVIIELKRDRARCGVETQALQYLADFSRFRGEAFLREFSGPHGVPEESILGHVGGSAKREDLNRLSRIMLVARSFDETLLSMGEWLSEKGVPFRLITYQPVELHGEALISFSVHFDRTPASLYGIGFESGIVREPGIYWHNIAHADESWWNFLVTRGQIPACFENAPGDQGEKLLTRYRPGDRIVAYAKGFGALGWGKIENAKYRLLAPGDPDDVLRGECRHRLGVRWQHVAPSLREGVPAETIRTNFSIYHPISTSVSIDPDNGERLLRHLSEVFPRWTQP